MFASDRINVISFDKHFDDDERDTELKNRLKTQENISGIFNICLGGLKDFMETGLTRPMSVSAATEQYRALSDRQGVFISECLEQDRMSNVTVKDVYGVYLEWCKGNNFRPENKSNFISGLKAKNMVTNFKKIGGISYHNVITGYKISDEYLKTDNSEGESWETPPL